MSVKTGDRYGGSFASDVWTTFVRWTIKSVRNPFVLVVSLVQPIIFLVLFTQVFGGVATSALEGVTYETYLVPAIVIQVALVAAATSGIGLVNDIENGMFEKTLVSPMNRVAVFVGKTLAEVVRIIAQVTIVLSLGVILGAEIATGLVGAVAIAGICVLFSVWFTAFSNVLAVVTRDEESTIIGANLLQLPLLFVSSAFLPLPALPTWIQTVATFNPITYGVDATRAVMLGEDTMTVIEVTRFGGMWDTLVPALAVLVCLALAFGSVAIYAISRAASADVR
ncbi:ABC transporter permease [Natrinema hispanicum]|uniref:ABC-2 type transport system permease protein n=1 Tax=Natrinema hispanicum TaxID=392421 RepID=A0A1G6N4S9_9EURY|nr:ABC transporter permease [Natrinema hispanicum]SDC62427.1 ABC-2 type transport system permease protein [Natrinema hispanicum]SET82475.1 ABC-2 type transport system permease protein [Natrinema hispanicum]